MAEIEWVVIEESALRAASVPACRASSAALTPWPTSIELSERRGCGGTADLAAVPERKPAPFPSSSEQGRGKRSELSSIAAVWFTFPASTSFRAHGFVNSQIHLKCDELPSHCRA